MHGEHSHSQQVRITQVVNESANVAKQPGIDAVCISHLLEEPECRFESVEWCALQHPLLAECVYVTQLCNLKHNVVVHFCVHLVV